LDRAIALSAAMMMVAAEYHSYVAADKCATPLPGMPAYSVSSSALLEAEDNNAGAPAPDEAALRAYMDENLDPARKDLLARRITPEQFWEELDRVYYSFVMAQSGVVDPVKLNLTIALNKEFRRLLLAFGNGALDGTGYLVAAVNLVHQIPRLRSDRVYATAFLSGRDADGDYVPDDFDQCPGTPRGVFVDLHGCPITTTIPRGDDKTLRFLLTNLALFYSNGCLDDHHTPASPQWTVQELSGPQPLRWVFGWEPVDDCNVRYILQVHIKYNATSSVVRTLMIPPSLLSDGIGPAGQRMVFINIDQQTSSTSVLNDLTRALFIGDADLGGLPIEVQSLLWAVNGGGHYSSPSTRRTVRTVR
jgi:hypothetical protein